MKKIFKFKNQEFQTLTELKKELVKKRPGEYDIYVISPDTGKINLRSFAVIPLLAVCKWCSSVIQQSNTVVPTLKFIDIEPPDKAVEFIDTEKKCFNPQCEKYAKYRKEFLEANGELYCSRCIECGKFITIHKGNDKPLCKTHGGVTLDKPSLKSFEEWCPLTRHTSSKFYRGMSFLDDNEKWLVRDRHHPENPEVYLLKIMNHWDFPRFQKEEMTEEEKVIAKKLQSST